MKNFITSLAFVALLTGTATAANVQTRLSAREGYVGMPITLQITISDAGDYQQPTLPEVDGCDIRSAGSPSQSSQVTSINGRRSESRSVTMRYLITPRREGTFEIPPIEIEIDGKMRRTPPQRFVATQSVTGDLLFVTIEGGKDKVFVGQPLDLTLKIWIKPYRDSERNVTLGEADMWNMISDQTSWGGFSGRIKELAENNQRPGGHEVLRDDGNGNERAYYLYEIEATVYPKRPGKIDADDIQIVVNYPTSLGKSRSPFSSIFEDSPLGGRSPFSSMLQDDFFSSAFSDRLTVASARPIVGTVRVDSTEVVPVPSEGRPDDYRGAVGRYQIVTQATPTTVNAGDPITLDIGIAGTGPMELVQAPPLAELSSLTADFKVTDQPLAGFVQDDTKLFSTTIRPRRAGITEIPPIRFSFFDPATETYHTVTSDPIPITVDASETLALDAIVSTAKSNHAASGDASAGGGNSLPDFTNLHSSGVLVSRPPQTQVGWWWGFVIVPPLVWCAAWMIRQRRAIADWMPNIRSARTQCLNAIDRARNADVIVTALTRYIARRSGQSIATTDQAIGVLRTAGMYDLAGRVESYLNTIHDEPLTMTSQQGRQWLAMQKRTAAKLIEELESSFRERKMTRIRPPKVRFEKHAVSGVARRSSGLFLLIAITALSASPAFADATQISDTPRIFLSENQQETLLKEAGAAYEKARQIADSADAKALFQRAAEKYQLLVDSGIENGRLYTNLGNAFLQSGQLGRAIASYERAIRSDPGNRQVRTNLEYANARVSGQSPTLDKVAATTLGSIAQRLRSANALAVEFIGASAVIWTLVVSSVVFWGLLIDRTLGRRRASWRAPTVCGAALLLVFSAVSMALTESRPSSSLNAVIVADNVSLHAGDGEQFAAVVSLENAQGRRVEVLGNRGDWTHVRTASGQTGWVHAGDVESFLPTA